MLPTPYHLQWSEELIRHVELRLRQLHACLNEFYQKNNYSTASFTGAEALDSVSEPIGRNATDPVQAAGSFLLRTCVHSTPFYETQLKRGVGADLVLTVAEEVCSLKDVQIGLYLDRRHEFLLKVERFLRKYAKRMVQEETGKNGGTSEGGRNGDGSSDVKEDGRQRRKYIRWDIQRVPFGDCWVNEEKYIIRIVFLRDSSNATRREVFHVDLHFQPISVSGRIASVAAIRKHPYYSHLVLEDALMTTHLRKLHNLFSNSNSLQRAAVFLNCWAHHTGIMARTSGHPEALSGFHLSAVILRLVEEGVVSPSMSEENVVRAVWVYLSRGLTLTESYATLNNDGEGKNHEEVAGALSLGNRSDVAVLRLEGETMNLLFRTSTSFLKQVVKKAADDAMQYQRSSEVLLKTPFQPLQLSMDVCLVVSGLEAHFAETNSAGNGKTGGAAYLRPEEVTQKLYLVVCEALGVRASYVTMWRRSADAAHVAVRLATEAEGRNRLTRGPPLEDTEAVSRFNNFWGNDITSTRQFPDGGIYRCVLWTFDHDAASHAIVLPATTVVRRVVQFALEKHIGASARVAVLLNGLEGVLAERVGAEWRDTAPLVEKSLLDACRAVETMVVDIPRTALPCKITSLDIVSASERHTATFPVRPHIALTYTTDDITQPCFAGLSVAPTIEPVHGVLTIDDRNKIPDTVEAIATMKGAICAQLSKVLQEQYGDDEGKVDGGTSIEGKEGKLKKEREEHISRQGEGETCGKETEKLHIRSSCTAHSVDIIFKGYLFRLYIAHYREVSLLRALGRESEASTIERKLFWSAQHAKFLRTISFGHSSYATATRIASRWMSAMLLYEFIVPEAVELLVANAYLGAVPPKTPASGFLRFLQLLACHDWKEPLVLPYSMDSKEQAEAAALVRSMGEERGMFIATPYAPLESPFTVHTPRPLIVHRVVQLAKAALSVLIDLVSENDSPSHLEAAVFTPNPSDFDFQMVLHPCLLLQTDRLIAPPSIEKVKAAGANGVGSGISGAGTVAGESTDSPATARVWRLDELEAAKSRIYISELVEREPAAHVVRSVRAATRDRSMVFYDCLAPRSISVITITSHAPRNHCSKLHDDILRISRGALLPTALRSLTSEEETATNEVMETKGVSSRVHNVMDKDAIVAAARGALRRKRSNINEGKEGKSSKRPRREGSKTKLEVRQSQHDSRKSSADKGKKRSAVAEQDGKSKGTNGETNKKTEKVAKRKVK
ncbi:Nrap protein [Trypanosoma brucei equiperdum]|uniref:Nrap protein n=1 Tax=Trypanosoma brucei equiperdum TaxID=630700 RepID=A0A3L6L001_9TRYP|nr:Nrap protein [Trypanosoma brucei equiperdum]